MLHLGSIRGTSIDVDLSFLILILFFVATTYNPQQGIHYALIWAPILFVSVLIHELAHAGMIGALGHGSSHVVLGGMGGVTINQRRARPWQDMLISLAGPISSFVLGWIAWQIFVGVPAAQGDKFLQVLLPKLTTASYWWGIFNLIPIAPLDGGKAVRSFLSMFLKDRTSFVIAVWIGMLVGTGVAILAFVTRWFFLGLMVGWFVYQNYVAWQYFREHGVPGD